MDETLADAPASSEQGGDLHQQPNDISDEVITLRHDFQSRLVAANLRTEAVRAGMIDLDGLKLIDASTIRLDSDDKIIGGRKIMDDLKRNKPWLFTVTSSSAAVAPVSQPVRRKTALEMTNDEYAMARAAVVKHLF